ncbi:MAG TPA: phospholipase [Acidimicrobiia bacterium]|nr:phospholipase [Acidimicrobiia bacterium]
MGAHAHAHHHDYGPSYEGTVVLDIGGDVGALVVHMPSSLLGHEIELVRSGDEVPFVHTAVRERHLPGATTAAAVFVNVPAGDFAVVGVHGRASFPVTIVGGRVTEATW